MHPSIRVRLRISERAAYNMVVAMAIHGNHNKDIHRNIQTVANISDHFEQNGRDFRVEVTKCRDFRHHVSMYENSLGAQWTAQGITVSKVDHIMSEHKEVISGDGTYNEADYWELFDLAREDFDKALETGRYERYLSAVNSGLASIEALLNHQYLVRMRIHSGDEALKSEIEAKIDEWVPFLTGHRFDKGGQNWAAFKKLKALRNEHFQHRKSVASGITFRQLVELLNEFRFGICRLLLELHVLFGQRCPTAIIRYSYYPEIEYVKAKSLSPSINTDAERKREK